MCVVSVTNLVVYPPQKKEEVENFCLFLLFNLFIPLLFHTNSQGRTCHAVANVVGAGGETNFLAGLNFFLAPTDRRE